MCIVVEGVGNESECDKYSIRFMCARPKTGEEGDSWVHCSYIRESKIQTHYCIYNEVKNPTSEYNCHKIIWPSSRHNAPIRPLLNFLCQFASSIDNMY